MNQEEKIKLIADTVKKLRDNGHVNARTHHASPNAILMMSKGSNVTIRYNITDDGEFIPFVRAPHNWDYRQQSDYVRHYEAYLRHVAVLLGIKLYQKYPKN